MFDLQTKPRPEQDCWLILLDDRPLAIELEGRWVPFVWSAMHLAVAFKSRDDESKLGKITAWTIRQTLDWCIANGVESIAADVPPRPIKRVMELSIVSIEALLSGEDTELIKQGADLAMKTAEKMADVFSKAQQGLAVPANPERLEGTINGLLSMTAAELDRTARAVRHYFSTAPANMRQWIEAFAHASLKKSNLTPQSIVKMLCETFRFPISNQATAAVFERIKADWIAWMEAVPRCAKPASGAYIIAGSIIEEIDEMLRCGQHGPE